MKGKILVVDDDWAILEMLKHVLTLCGYEVLMAKNDTEFCDQARTSKPDMIILDIMLGEKDGVQVYEKLLNEGFDSKVPVVFLSALASGRPASPPQPGRKYALLGKPFDLEELVEKINDLVHV